MKYYRKSLQLVSTDLISQLWYKPTYHDHPSEQNKLNKQNLEAIKNSCKTERYPYYYWATEINRFYTQALV